MNKKLTRLTALLLAMLMMMSTFGTALADTTLTIDQYTQSLQQMQEDLSLIPVQLETPNVYTTTVNTTTLVPTYAAGEGEVSPVQSITVTAQTAAEDVGGYQWMICVNGVWANIQGETAQTLELTYAMAKSAMDEKGNVQLRCRLFPAVAAFALTEPEAVYEDEITVKVNEAVTYTEQIDTKEVTVTQYTQNEKPDEDYYAAWELQNAAKTPAVSTFGLTRAGETDSTNCNIIINYVFENNDVASETYTASIAKGTNFDDTVTFPTVQGYLPYIGNEQKSSYTFEITGIQEDVILTVTYKPTNVNYTVIHYWQNVDDDNYTIYATETRQGLTESIVPEVAKIYTVDNDGDEKNETTVCVDDKYKGFYSLLYNRPEIAADGSTKVEVYYDRNYYLMLFELDGGYGVEPIYARYGADLGEIVDPTKAGWDFQYWAEIAGGTNAVTLPKTMPAVEEGNTITYYAIWGDPQTVKYTVVYWKENADDSNYSFWGQVTKTARVGTTVSGSDDIPASITTTTVNGSQVNERPYFTYNAAKTQQNVEVKGDESTVVNVYYYRNTYTIYFRGINGKCVIEEHRHGTNCNSFLDCSAEEHTHDANCTRELSCKLGEHTHIDGCTELICTVPEHSEHTDECLECDTPVHEAHDDECCTIIEEHPMHDASCCTITVHTHTDACYTCMAHSHSDSCCENGGTGLLHWWHSDSCCSLNLTSHTHGDGNCTYKDTEHTHGDGSCTCTKTIHTHGGSSCTCDKEIHYHSEDQGCYSDVLHSHDDSCYGLTCGQAAHTHTDSCYVYTCGGADHTHTSSCYRPCTKLVHTHTSNCNNNRTDNVIWVVTAKYEQTIGDVWPTAADFSNYSLRGWEIDGIDANATSKRVNMTSDLCDTSDGLKYAKANSNTNKKYLYYMFESFDQTSPANGNERIYKNGKYYDKSDLYYQEVNSSGDWNQKAIYGMSPVTNGVTTSGSNVFLYYNRNRSNLMYHNVNGVVKTVSSIMFEQPLVNYKDSSGNLLSAYVPPYPSTLEANAYEFEGWYTTPECYADTKFDFATATMPNGDLTLYANWVPVNRTVKFSLDRAAYDAKEELYESITVPHRSKVDPIPATPDNGDYEFVGWFYVEDGVEKAFDFENMVVTKDMWVYGKWSSNVLREYTVYFKYEDPDTGEVTEIADPITGSMKAGLSKTFEAKGGTDLDEGYQEGYFPVFESHTINANIEHDDNEGDNTFTFWYVRQPAVPYTVYYVAETLKDGGTSLGTVELKDEDDNVKTYYIIAETYTNSENRKAVVTEQFKVVSGYVPDQYQKRLVVTVDKSGKPNTDANVIVFYYTVDSSHAYYKITHYTLNTDGSTWTEYASSQAKGDIGTTYSEEPMSIEGFDYVDEYGDKTSVTSGVLTENGLTLELYYIRNEYPYQVRYLKEGSGEKLHDPKNGKNLYGKVISEEAIFIENYVVVTETPQTLVINIDKIDEATGSPALNIITFYYREKDVTLNYKVVGPAGCGTVDLNDGVEDPQTTTSETVKVFSGAAKGATAAAASDAYKFVGWYSDEACTKLLSTDPNYRPTKADGTAWVDGTTYYAKFEYNTVSLTINKTVRKGDFENGTLTFSFTVYVTNSEGTYVPAKRANGASAVVTIRVSPDDKTADGVFVKQAVISDLLYVEDGIYKVIEGPTTDYSYSTTMNATNPATAENPDGKISGTTELEGIIIPAGGSATVDVVNTANDKYYATVTKIWEDNGNALGYRPEKTEDINLALVTGDQRYELSDSDRIDMNDDNDANTWVYTKLVPKYDEFGDVIQYSVSEGAVPYYTPGDPVEVSKNEVTITNTINVGHLLITKNGLREGDSAIFTIKVNEAVYTTVVLTGGENGSSDSVKLINLPAGASYEVVEDNNWSNRYTIVTEESSGMSGSIPAGNTAQATITNQYNTDKWLDDEGAAKNVFRVTKPQTQN